MSILKALQKTIVQTPDEKELFEEVRDRVWKRFKFKNTRSAFSFFSCGNIFVPFLQKSKHSLLWKKMEITGVLSMELVDHVFSKFCQQSFAKESILHLMEQFGLIAKCAFPINDVKYFVPAQLRSQPGRLCHLKPAPTDPCSLYLQFPSGFVPHGLFTQLVSRCTRWCSKIEFKEAPRLFDGVARFTLLSKDFSYQLICVGKKSFIKFLLRHFQTQPCQAAPLTEIEEMASLVWRFLKQTMTSLLDEWPYLTSLEYNWCVACTDCSEGHVMCDSHGKVACRQDDCSCLLKILQDGQMNNCPKSFGNKTTNVPGLEKWFPIKGEENLSVTTRNLHVRLTFICTKYLGIFPV